MSRQVLFLRLRKQQLHLHFLQSVTKQRVVVSVEFLKNAVGAVVIKGIVENTRAVGKLQVTRRYGAGRLAACRHIRKRQHGKELAGFIGSLLIVNLRDYHLGIERAVTADVKQRAHRVDVIGIIDLTRIL